MEVVMVGAIEGTIMEVVMVGDVEGTVMAVVMVWVMLMMAQWLW